MADNKRPIIIKKKKKAHDGHHGGAWKIAYADFVTAMMAFFLLMWLTSSVEEEKLKGISEYFTPGLGKKGQSGVGVFGGQNPNNNDGSQISQAGDQQFKIGVPTEALNSPEDDRAKAMDEENLQKIYSQLEQAINQNETLRQFADSIFIDITPEGLRIQIVDEKDRPMFRPGTAILQSYMKEILSILGEIISLLPNYISIDGHTRPKTREELATLPKFDSWLLSAQRSNSVRKYLTEDSVKTEQVLRIVGKAEEEPLFREDPSDYRNSRTSIILVRSHLVSPSKRAIPSSAFQPK